MKTSGIPFSSLPPRLQAQVRALDGKQLQQARETDVAVITAALNAPPPSKPRLRQSSKGPNKTEAAFAAYLRALHPTSTIEFEAVSLKLGNGVRYWPDIMVHDGVCTEKVRFYETKGFARDDSIVKIKVAARVHSWALFYLVTRRGRTCGGWDIQHILP